MGGGNVLADGTPARVLTRENIRKAYGVDSEISTEGDRAKISICMVPEPLPPASSVKPYASGRDEPVGGLRKMDSGTKIFAVFAVAVILCSGLLVVLHGSGDEYTVVGEKVSPDDMPYASRLWVLGNANGDDKLDDDDLQYLKDYIAGGGRYEYIMDADADGKLTNDDVVYLDRILDAQDTGARIDVFYVDNYLTVQKVSWPVNRIAIGYCSGMYCADVTGVLSKVRMVDTTIVNHWAKYYSDLRGLPSYGTTEEPNCESMMGMIDVYVPGYCDANKDPDLRASLEPAGVDVMFMNTCDNSGIDLPNEYIDRSILMFGFLLQGDMLKTYEYLQWHDEIVGYAKSTGPGEGDPGAMLMARNYSGYNKGQYSITGYNNTNNIHAEWANIYAIGQHDERLNKNYNTLSTESVLAVLNDYGHPLYYVDNEHDGTRGQYSLKECVTQDKKDFATSGAHFLGVAREIGNSPLYVIEMVFYQN